MPHQLLLFQDPRIPWLRSKPWLQEEERATVYFGMKDWSLSWAMRDYLTTYIRCAVDWEGPEKQKFAWNGFEVEIKLTVRPHGTHPGWISPLIFTCQETGIYHKSQDHSHCGNDCKEIDDFGRVRQQELRAPREPSRESVASA